MARRKEAAETADACRFADLLLEIVHKICLCRFQSGAETEKNGRDEAEQKCDGEYGRIRPQFNDEGKIHRAEQPRERMEQKIVAPNADDEPDQAAADGEQQTFAE